MHPVELLQKRFDIVKKLSALGQAGAASAHRFLMETMVDSRLAPEWLERWAPVLGDSGRVDILASRSDEKLRAVFFKVIPPLEGVFHPRHALAFFAEASDGAELKLSHELDMDALWQDFCAPCGSITEIRQLGDAILHQAALPVKDVSHPDVSEQIRIMKEDLIATGGVGIAANQCARIKKPLSIVLSGVDYTSPRHVSKVMRRYPGAFFPPVTVCINPEITHQGEEKEFFAEGCLSARSPFRAEVSRPGVVTVRYQDPEGEWHQDHLQGADARVMLHEIDHIRNGKVYIQHIIDELTEEQCEILHALIEEALHQADAVAKPMQDPAVLFGRDRKGSIVFDADQAKRLFDMTDPAVLRAMSEILQGKVRQGCSKSFLDP